MSIDNPEKRTETPVRSTVERLRAEAYGSAFSSALIPAPDRFLLALSSAFLHVMGGRGHPWARKSVNRELVDYHQMWRVLRPGPLEISNLRGEQGDVAGELGHVFGSMSSGMVCLSRVKALFQSLGGVNRT